MYIHGWTPVSRINRGSLGSQLSGVFLSGSRTCVGGDEGGGSGISASGCVSVSSKSAFSESLLLSESGGVGGKSAGILRSCFVSSFVTAAVLILKCFVRKINVSTWVQCVL